MSGVGVVIWTLFRRPSDEAQDLLWAFVHREARYVLHSSQAYLTQVLSVHSSLQTPIQSVELCFTTERGE